MGRRTVLLLAAAIGLAVPTSASAATPTFKLRAPSAGDVAVAHVVFKAKGAGTLTLVNRAKLSPELLAVGGVRKLGGGRYLASLVLVQSRAREARASAASSALARVTAPRFRGFVRKQSARNILVGSDEPPFCRSRPRSFSYIGRRPLAGSLVPGFDARTTARIAYLVGCTDIENRAEFVQAIGGADEGGGSGGGSTGGAPDCEFDGSCDEGEQQGPTLSSTLAGGGTVTRDASNPNLFSYSVSFNEPVYGYRIQVPKTNIRCPTFYGDWKAECDALGDSNTPKAGSMTLTCPPNELTSEFECRGQSTGTRDRESSQYEIIPAGTTITGRFSIDAGSVETVRLIGLQGSNTESRPATLSGP